MWFKNLFAKTACTNAKTDYNAILTTVYGTTRRLVSDIYEAKDTNKCGARQGIVAFVGDDKCHTTLDGTSFKVTLGSSNTATDATFSTFSDKDCTKDANAVTIASANLATATTAQCANSIKWSISGTEPVTEAPATDAPTPAPATALAVCHKGIDSSTIAKRSNISKGIATGVVQRATTIPRIFICEQKSFE
eukprot:jgi/Phyca11/16133/fgenesh1_pg.PHYCAscaffold_18_\